MNILKCSSFGATLHELRLYYDFTLNILLTVQLTCGMCPLQFFFFFHKRVKLILLFLLRINDVNAECTLHESYAQPHVTISIICFKRENHGYRRRKKRMHNARTLTNALADEPVWNTKENHYEFHFDSHSHIIRMKNRHKKRRQSKHRDRSFDNHPWINWYVRSALAFASQRRMTDKTKICKWF